MQQNPSSDATGRYHGEENPGISYSPNFQGMFLNVQPYTAIVPHPKSDPLKKVFKFNVLVVLRIR